MTIDLYVTVHFSFTFLLCLCLSGCHNASHQVLHCWKPSDLMLLSTLLDVTGQVICKTYITSTSIWLGKKQLAEQCLLEYISLRGLKNRNVKHVLLNFYTESKGSWAASACDRETLSVVTSSMYETTTCKHLITKKSCLQAFVYTEWLKSTTCMHQFLHLYTS